MRSEKVRTKDADEKEVESLKTAVKRLDRWLIRATEAEHETLRAATARLDQWLQAIPKAKGTRPKNKRPKDNENSSK